MSLTMPFRPTAPAPEPSTEAQTDTELTRRTLRPVNLLALIGALMIAFEVWVIVRWVTGPYFKAVPNGPTQTSTAMHVALMCWQYGSIPVALGVIGWFVVRPWLRTRTIGVDGLLVLAFCTLWWQDPMSNYLGPWVTYNSSMINFGSWINSVPGALTQGSPGHMLVEPILFTPAAYIYMFTIVMFFGSWVLRRAEAIWPRMGKAGLIGVLFVTMLVFDTVLEGVLWLPMGIFEYPGGTTLALFAHSYHKFPLNELLTIGVMFTATAAIRHFGAKRGRTIAESGIERVSGANNGAKKVVLRVFATIAVIQLGMLAFYNIPNALVGAHSSTWPRAVQDRSYFTNGLCGAGTDRACPGPAVPLTRHGSAYLAPGGAVVTPQGAQVPPAVPFSK